jgi:micrococcal nuclease
MKKKTIIYFTCLLLLILITLNYTKLDGFFVKTFDDTISGVVSRVIDGDTIVVNNESVRMLGINTPERGEKYYIEAKHHLEILVLNKTVSLKGGEEKYDLYNRRLAYVFLNKEEINLRLIKEGYASPYFPTEVKGKEFYSAWEQCLEEGKNLCEESEDICKNCIILREINVKEQFIVLENQCNFKCNLTNWTIKDEGRKKYAFGKIYLDKKKSVKIDAEDFKEDYVWTSTGDSVFVKDALGKIVIYYRY